MLLTSNLGSKIVQEVRPLIDEHLIIANPEGVIIASTDRNRIGTFHEGAKRTCMEKQERTITVEDEHRLQGVKAGINLPIFVHDVPIGVIGITGEPNNVIPFGSLVKKMTELLIQENFYFQELEWEARALESFVIDMLQRPRPIDEDIEKGQLLGIDMTSNKRCTVITLTANAQPISHDMLHYSHHQLQQVINGVVARWGNDKFIILHNEDNHSQPKVSYYHYLFEQFQQQLRKRFDCTAAIGVGPSTTMLDVHQSFQKAKKAMVASIQKDTIVFYQDLQLEICLQDILPNTRKEFIGRTIGPILAENELMQTLKTYYSSNLNLAETAKTMNVHINTVHYRLRKIYDITSLDPKNVDSLVTIYLALTFLDENTNSD
ncbi:CdaR family transcriptional regulator [Aquibacillus sediminis]|uniref:CdaR family transcriptional regulator n=1 Tax=Aquibacillus sediminis TaxID=2574734 RepID=UPI0011094FD6|nr:sugar diacid recognition domain-containing protein [Aquibacillus sediminis]